MKNSKQTTLDLNGPILSFTSSPVGVASTGVVSGTGSGIATFTGIATASFTTIGVITNPATNTGYVTYRWYEVGVGALSDSTYVTGTATTTLTLTNLITPTDNRREFYLTADYVPSAYGLAGVAVTVGSARSTGNALIEPVNSGIATLTVYPLLEIVAQPSNRTVAANTNTTFTVDAGLTDNSFDSGLSYQWYLNGAAVDDGVIINEVTGSITVPSNLEYTYTSDDSLTIPASSSNIVIVVAGARGGNGGSDAGGSGGSGGSGRAGRFTYSSGGRTLSFKIGRRGNDGGSGNFSAYGGPGSSNVASGGRGGGAGGSGWSGGGGGGGGATGVYDSSVGAYTIIAAGGGGGGGGSWNRSANPGEVGLGFGQGSTSSISNGGQGEDKSGDGGGGGGGGGGATGGGGGGSGQDNAYGGGGGGGGKSAYNSSIVGFGFDGWLNDSDGYVNVKYTGTTTTPTKVTRRTTVSGTKTPTLTISSDSVGVQTVRCVISNSIATNSSILTDVVNFATVSTAEQYNINVESIGNSSTGTISAINLANGDYTITTSLGDPNTGRVTNFYSFYAPDRDIAVEMDLYGGKGSDAGSYRGGEGGFSRIRFTMSRNTEYVIAGLTTSINAPFIYRKGQLIACAGGGGNAGTSGNGGFGGGVGVSGAAGSGRGSGDGGVVYRTGTLLSNGIFGSLYFGGINIPTTPRLVYPDDNRAYYQFGGRALSCTKGIYWKDQGFTACQDIGTSQFRLSDGTLVTNTGSITRGFKAGYNIMETAGSAQVGSSGGNGGYGATGGNGGGEGGNGGGGGGSGYTDGSVTVVTSTLGGSTGNARVVLRVVG